MRKLLFIFVLLLVVSLSGCDFDKKDDVIIDDDLPEDNIPVDEIDEYPIELGVGFFYSLEENLGETTLPNKFFGASFSDISFNPLKNEMCFVININDPSYRTSEYWVITRENGSLRTDSQFSFRIGSTNYQGRDCIGVPEGISELVIGKIDSEDLNPSEYIDVMAAIVFEDRESDNRVRVESVRVIEKDYGDFFRFDYSEMPYLEFDIEINDPNRILNEVLVEVEYELLDLIVYQEILTITEDNYIDNVITFDNIFIEGVCPGCEYTVHVYASGNDSVEDFVYYEILDKDIETQEYFYSYRDNQVHGLWAVPTRLVYGETTTELFFILENDKTVVSASDGLPFSIVIKILSGNDTGGQLVHTIEVPDGATSVVIDNQYLDQYYAITMQLDREDIILFISHVNYNLPEISGFVTSGNDIRFNLDLGDFEILNIKAEFRTGYDQPIYMTIDSLDLTLGEIELTAPIDLSGYDTVYVDYYVTFIGLHGEETVKLSRSEYYRNRN